MKIMTGRVNLADFLFAREYRGRDSYAAQSLKSVPAAVIAGRLTSKDPRAEPRVKERVPFLIVAGLPKAQLITLVRTPEEFLATPSLHLNATYYICKGILPPLDRALGLVGVQVRQWYDELPRINRVAVSMGVHEGTRRAHSTITQFFQSHHCLVCDEVTTAAVCDKCRADPQHTAVTVCLRIKEWEAKACTLQEVCYRCTQSRDPNISCTSVACPVYFERIRSGHKLKAADALRRLEF